MGRGEAPKPGSDVTVLSRHEETAEAGSSVRMKAVSAGISHGHSVPIQSPIGPASAGWGSPVLALTAAHVGNLAPGQGLPWARCLSPAKAGVGVVMILHFQVQELRPAA